MQDYENHPDAIHLHENFIVLPHEPTEEELAQYKNSDEKITQFILDLLPDDSREKQLLSQKNMMKYLLLVEKIFHRINREKNGK